MSYVRYLCCVDCVELAAINGNGGNIEKQHLIFGLYGYNKNLLRYKATNKQTTFIMCLLVTLDSLLLGYEYRPQYCVISIIDVLGMGN